MQIITNPNIYFAQSSFLVSLVPLWLRFFNYIEADEAAAN